MERRARRGSTSIRDSACGAEPGGVPRDRRCEAGTRASRVDPSYRVVRVRVPARAARRLGALRANRVVSYFRLTSDAFFASARAAGSLRFDVVVRGRAPHRHEQSYRGRPATRSPCFANGRRRRSSHDCNPRARRRRRRVARGRRHRRTGFGRASGTARSYQAIVRLHGPGSGLAACGARRRPRRRRRRGEATARSRPSLLAGGRSRDSATATLAPRPGAAPRSAAPRALSRRTCCRVRRPLQSPPCRGSTLIPRREFERIAAPTSTPTRGSTLLADMCRANALVAVKRAGSGHLGSTFSSLDLVVAPALGGAERRRRRLRLARTATSSSPRRATTSRASTPRSTRSA